MVSNQVLVEVALSIVLFLGLWIVLGAILFKPFIKLLEEREARTTGAEHGAVEKREEARRLEKRLSDARREARVQGIIEREKIVQTSRTQSRQLVESAMLKAEKELARSRDEIEKLKERATQDLERETLQLSQSVMTKVMTVGRVLH